MQCVMDFLMERQSKLSALARETCPHVEFDNGFTIIFPTESISLRPNVYWKLKIAEYSFTDVSYRSNWFAKLDLRCLVKNPTHHLRFPKKTESIWMFTTVDSFQQKGTFTF